MGTRWIALAVFAAWAAVIAGTFLRYGTNGEKIFSNPKNKRVFHEPRGAILDRNGTILAYGNGSNRHYTLGEAAAHVVGYLYPKVGAGGMVEGTYGHLLRRVNRTRNFYFIDKPVQMVALKTTLDVKLQKAADLALGARRGAIIVLKSETGEILALVSHPSFDPNSLGQNWRRINARKIEAPLVNRATAGYYPPGSVWKIVDAACLLTNGNPHTDYYCNGIYTIGDRVIGCPIPHGQVGGLNDAFVRSCNGYFVDRIIKEVKQNDFFRVYSVFANRKVGDHMDVQDYALAAIGQGVIELTPLEGALLAAAVANKGFMPSPVIILQEQSQQKRTLKEVEALQLQKMMVDVVRRGTGRALANFINTEYKVGVKTGTAERIQKDGNKTNVGWMIGFAGKKEPEIAFAVVVEDSSGYAGEICSPIVRKVLNIYLASTR